MANSIFAARTQPLDISVGELDVDPARRLDGVHEWLKALRDRLLCCGIACFPLLRVAAQAELVSDLTDPFADVFAAIVDEVGGDEFGLEGLRRVVVDVDRTVSGVVEEPDALFCGIDGLGERIATA